MFGLEMIEVVIGLCFIYLLLSLMCSALNEIIEAWLKMRAVDLEQGIRELLNDHDGKGLTLKLYNHPLIYGLFRGDYQPDRISGGQNRGRYPSRSDLPSYIPSSSFALALMSIIAPKSESVDASATPVQAFRDAAGKIENEKVKQALTTLADAAGDDAVRLRESIEEWFNSAMDRVAGWYKRRAQGIILLLAFVITALTNADTITLAKSLSFDQELRKCVATAAQKYNDSQSSNPKAVPVSVSEDPKLRLENAKKKFKEELKVVQSLGLPIGWNETDPRTMPDGFGWVLKIFGWFLTAMAVSLGAPFWFDLLNRFMLLRSTVKPSEKNS